MKMHDEEKVADYFVRVDESINAIRGLVEDIEDKDIVQKVMRSLPSKYDSKLSAIEELKELNTLTMNDLHGILISYEMRACSDETIHKESAFKVEKKNKETQKGVRKIQGQTTFKCFNYGKLGHFSANCPLDDSDKENLESFSKQRTLNIKKKFPLKLKKSLYAKGDVTDSNTEESMDDESEVLFMTTECLAGNQGLNDVVLSDVEG
ncbi:uncharacterized protein LOC131856399 [Cryptomeria japonica]|uniref:uncharacterized protein LOC131856399 n=1 Tax=Cryptomeria japonica TaxID=3369 RepID=UPI0027D9FDD8|nr:uncharacterized protein LOC131856399 [Cryptomeria japonica]